MRRPFLFLVLVVLAMSAAACAGTAGPAWTYAPPTPAPSATPVASGEASAAPSGGASAAPSEVASAPPSGVASAAPSGGTSGGGGEVVEISALNIAFEQTEVSAPAGAAFTIHFNNKDAGVPHNVAIKDASGMEMFKGDIVTGPIETDYQEPALPAGTYQFVCTVHTNMTGTLKVGG